MPRMSFFLEILRESVLLFLVFIGIAFTAIVFEHAAGGTASLLTWEQSLFSRAKNDSSTPATWHTTVIDTPALTPLPEVAPSHVWIPVAFTPQAPFGDWTPPFNEACEEASLVMALAWARGDPPTNGLIPPEQASKEILDQVEFENYYFGYHTDTALAEILKIIKIYYHFESAMLAFDISLNDIRRELASGNIVLVPVAGEILQNPYFTNLPPYHVLLIVGYDDATREFITNDPGTKRGANYRYTYETIDRAIHDWTGDESTLLFGKRGMIVISRETVTGQ